MYSFLKYFTILDTFSVLIVKSLNVIQVKMNTCLIIHYESSNLNLQRANFTDTTQQGSLRDRGKLAISR